MTETETKIMDSLTHENEEMKAELIKRRQEIENLKVTIKELVKMLAERSK